eukprot:gene302-27_t
MSHQTYNQKYASAMQELQEQIQIENLVCPQPNEDGEVENDGKSFSPNELQNLYVKYMQICKTLEDTYDQMVQPQKRRCIKQVLESIMIRILELKKQMIMFNQRPDNAFVPLDGVLSDLKLPFETMDWKVPRYFLDDKERLDDLETKRKTLDHWVRSFSNEEVSPDGKPKRGLGPRDAVPSQDLVDKTDPFRLQVEGNEQQRLSNAVQMIIRNERGRVGIGRAMMKAEMNREQRRKEKRVAVQEKDEKDIMIAATYIAAAWKRKVAMKQYEKMRTEELQVLGMLPKPASGEDWDDTVSKIRERRKQSQQDAEEGFQLAMKKEKEWVAQKTGPDIKMDLLEARRNWALDQYRKTGNLPQESEGFYHQQVEGEEGEGGGDAKKGKKDDKKKGDKKKGDKKKGDKKKGDKKKGKKGEPEEAEEVQLGASAVVGNFVSYVDEYNKTWDGRDESRNFEQLHDVELCRQSVQPEVEMEIRTAVDEIIKQELKALNDMYDKSKKKKKKKGKKKGKKDKKKKKGKKWCKAVGSVPRVDDACVDLIRDKILVKIKPANLEDFKGQYNYLESTLRVNEPIAPPPSALLIKNLIVEHCMLPLASVPIRQQHPNIHVSKSLLLFGPKGSGKSMLARAIATQCGAQFFNISPEVTNGMYTNQKDGAAYLVYKTFLCAQEMAPSVIYMDDIEQIFTASKKKGKGDKNAPDRIQKDLIAMKKQIMVGTEATKKDSVLIIGTCTNPAVLEGGGLKNALDFFDDKVWVNFPDYGSNRLLWKHFIEKRLAEAKKEFEAMKKKGEKIEVPNVTLEDCDLDLSSLAHASGGYSAGSMEMTVNRVLSLRRIQGLKNRGLTVTEMTNPLSRTHYTYPQDWLAARNFDYEASGDKKRVEALTAENLEGGDKKDAKKK